MTKQTATENKPKVKKEGKTARGLRLRRLARNVILNESSKLQNQVEKRIKPHVKTPQDLEECSLYLIKELHRMFKFMAISGDLSHLETDIIGRTKKLEKRWDAEDKTEKQVKEKAAADKAKKKKERETKATIKTSAPLPEPKKAAQTKAVKSTGKKLPKKEKSKAKK